MIITLPNRSLIHNEDLHSRFPIVSIAFIRPTTNVHVLNDFKFFLQTVVQLNGVRPIEEQNSVVLCKTRLFGVRSFFVLKITCLTIGLLLLYIILVTLLAHFHLQKAETVLGLAAINFMSAENLD